MLSVEVQFQAAHILNEIEEKLDVDLKEMASEYADERHFSFLGTPQEYLSFLLLMAKTTTQAAMSEEQEARALNKVGDTYIWGEIVRLRKESKIYYASAHALQRLGIVPAQWEPATSEMGVFS